MEMGLRFSMAAYSAHGPGIRPIRRARRNLLQTLARAVAPIDRRLVERRHTKIEGAPGVRPMLVAVLVVILRWPDTDREFC